MAQQRRSHREQLFVLEYVKDRDGAAAMRRMGFRGKRPDCASYKLLQKPSVKRQIDRLLAHQIQRSKISTERVLEELRRVAFSDVRALVDQEGRIRPLHELDDENAAQISSIEVEELYESEFEDGPKRRVNVGRVTKLKRWEKIRALELLGRHLKLFEQPVAPGAATGPGLTVIVQGENRRVGIATQPGVAGHVLVDLPGPG